MTRVAQILATGRYIPEKVITNDDLNEMLGENVGDWLVENVGIHERHVMADDEATSDMIVAASRQALDRAGLAATDLDLILVATDTPDYLSPATASAVQAKLGAIGAGTYDVNCACAAWVTALDMAARYIATDADYRYILVAGGYGMTKFIDWTDKYTCTLFADGAGVAIVGAGEEPGFLSGKLFAAGEYHDALGIYTGGTYRPATPEVVNELGKPRVQFVRIFHKVADGVHRRDVQVERKVAEGQVGIDQGYFAVLLLVVQGDSQIHGDCGGSHTALAAENGKDAP